MPKIGLIVTDNFSAWNFRRGLMIELVKKKFETCILTPSGEYDNNFKHIGVKHIPIEIYRFLSPIMDVKFILNLYKLFLAENFDIVHNFSVKPNIYGSIAAHLAGVPIIISSVTGRGSIFFDNRDYISKLLKPVLSIFYKVSLNYTTKVWFQNWDDLDYFVSYGMVKRNKSILIPSSGIDLDSFSINSVDEGRRKDLKLSLKLTSDDTVVTMVCRALWTKGIKEFIATSRLLLNSNYHVKFLLIGNIEKGNPISATEEYLRENQSDNFKWLGWRNDVKEILAISDVIVLLSRYGEGIPRSLLEGMAMSKPIVATNVVGCRNVVEEGKNGYLVNVNDINGLAKILIGLINDPIKLASFGNYSRNKVEKEYNINNINKRILSELYNIG